MKKIEIRGKAIMHRSIYLLITVLLSMTMSCNQEYPNLLNDYPDPNVALSGKNNKVLLITVDGISGSALLAMSETDVPTTTIMKRNSLFAMRSLSDFEKNDLGYSTAYATLFTGVTSQKHAVNSNNDTLPEDYPTFIKRIKAYNSTKKSTVFSTNQEAFDNLSEGVDQVEYLNSDAEAVDKAVASLYTVGSDMLIVNLSNPEKVGALVSFDINNPTYREAIKEFDANLKKIKTALEARPSYNTENWLVIVTSTKGASLNNISVNSAYDDLNRDTFTIYYNKNFNSIPVATPNLAVVPYSGTSPVYNGDINANRVATIPNDLGTYNFGTGDFTIRFSVKGSGVEKTWPVFLSKAGRIDDSGPGWRLYISRKLLSVQVGGNGSWANWGTNLVINDGKWHNVIVVFFTEGGRRKVKAFVDGVKSEAIHDITDRGTVTTSEPLRIGRNRADADLPDLQLTHLQLYNKAWSDQDVFNTFCKIEVDENSLHFNNLVGYWPSDDDGGVLRNHAPNVGTNKDFILSSTIGYRQFNDINELLCPKIQPSFYQMVPNAVDVATTVYAWMAIPMPSSWKLDGKVWPFTFNNIKP